MGFSTTRERGRHSGSERRDGSRRPSLHTVLGKGEERADNGGLEYDTTGSDQHPFTYRLRRHVPLQGRYRRAPHFPRLATGASSILLAAHENISSQRILLPLASPGNLGLSLIFPSRKGNYCKRRKKRGNREGGRGGSRATQEYVASRGQLTNFLQPRKGWSLSRLLAHCVVRSLDLRT